MCRGHRAGGSTRREFYVAVRRESTDERFSSRVRGERIERGDRPLTKRSKSGEYSSLVISRRFVRASTRRHYRWIASRISFDHFRSSCDRTTQQDTNYKVTERQNGRGRILALECDRVVGRRVYFCDETVIRARDRIVFIAINVSRLRLRPLGRDDAERRVSRVLRLRT